MGRPPAQRILLLSRDDTPWEGLFSIGIDGTNGEVIRRTLARLCRMNHAQCQHRALVAFQKAVGVPKGHTPEPDQHPAVYLANGPAGKP